MNGSGLPEVGCPLRKYYLFVESQEVGRRFQTLLQRGNGSLRKEVACWGTGGGSREQKWATLGLVETVIPPSYPQLLSNALSKIPHVLTHTRFL